MATASFLDSIRAAPRAAHPHLSPFNSRTFAQERAAAMQSVEGLLAYRRFLAGARAMKASRRRVSQSFERHVQKQSRQALSDMNALMNNALSITGQVNHTALWDSVLKRSGAALERSGPTTMQDLWRDLRGRPEAMSALRDFGITESMVSLSDDLVARADVTISANYGHVEFSAATGAGHQRHTIKLQSGRAKAASVSELFGRPSFDQMAAAFAREDDVFVSGPASPSARCEPGEVLAVGAFVSRQMLVDHVRKLEDMGLATYAGEEPTTLVIIIALGLLFALVGYMIRSACDTDPENLSTPPLSDFVCDLGDFLFVIGIAMIFAGVAIAVLPLTVFLFGEYLGVLAAFGYGGLALGALDYVVNGPGFEIQLGTNTGIT